MAIFANIVIANKPKATKPEVYKTFQELRDSAILESVVKNNKLIKKNTQINSIKTSKYLEDLTLIREGE